MEGRCIFVFFMIFNAILGLTGLALLGGGIALAVTKQTATGADSSVANNAFIALIVIGAYITTILILGACSWKKNGVLIAYFVLILLLIIVEIVMIILVKVGEKKYYDLQPPGFINESFDLSIKINVIVYSVSLGIAFLSFLFSTIYFCLMRKEGDPQLYSDVRKMEELNAVPQYQNL